MVGSFGEVEGGGAVHVRRPGRDRRQQVGALEGGRGGQVAGLAREGGLVPVHPACHVAYQHLPPVGVVARVDEPAGRMPRQALRHRPPCGGVVGAADDKALAVVDETGVAVPTGAGVVVVLAERVHRVADGPVVGPCQPVCEDLALEAAHIPGVEVLAEQVVGLHPVVVDQDDVDLPPLEEAAEALGNEASRSAAADHRYPGVVQQKSVVQVVGHSITSFSLVSSESGPSPTSRRPWGGPSKTCAHSTGAKCP